MIGVKENCNEYFVLLSACVDGELSPEEQARLDAHLEACADCRAELEMLQSIHTNAPALTREVGGDFTQRIMQGMKASKKSEKRFALSRFKFTAIAAAVALLLLAADKLPWPEKPDADSAESAAVTEEAPAVMNEKLMAEDTADAGAADLARTEKASGAALTAAKNAPVHPYAQEFALYITADSPATREILSEYTCETVEDAAYIIAPAAAAEEIRRSLTDADIPYRTSPGTPDAEFLLVILPAER